MEAFELADEPGPVWAYRAELACATRLVCVVRFQVLRCAIKPARALAFATRGSGDEDNPAQKRWLTRDRFRESLAAMLRWMDVISLQVVCNFSR
jgi:hypothetical protein